jgi:membrane-associated phospholipid phosphatase
MQRFPFMRFAAGVLRVLGWVVLVLGVLGSIGFVLYGAVLGGVGNILVVIGGAVVGIICSFLAWVFLLATREIFHLLIHVEENTRTTAERTTRGPY